MLYVTEVSRNEFRITMSSSLSLIKDFIEEVAEYAKAREIPVDEFSLKFALVEAVTNAIEHGNKKNARLLVKFFLSFDDRNLQMVFEDEGTGFNWRERHLMSCPDSTAISGRGLFIIKECGFTIHFNEAGNRLTLARSLADHVS